MQINKVKFYVLIYILQYRGRAKYFIITYWKQIKLKNKYEKTK